jgi:hypothetical protein
MKKQLILGLLAAAASSQAATFTTFSYNQSDATTGAGTISAFSYAGHDFPAMNMPAATVFSPGTVAAPAGFVGSQTVASGAGNEGNTTVGLLWTGTITATATDGATIQIPLVFAPKQVQSPADTHDYTWNVTFGDSTANGIDVVGVPRFAMFFNRDTVADATDTANLFQRYTQTTFTFTAGATDTFNNTESSFNPTTNKDATDSGNPAGTDAVGRDLAFYFAWRDQGPVSPLTGGAAILIDQFNVGGLLQVNEASLVVPEPTTTGLLIMGGLGAFVALRRRKA